MNVEVRRPVYINIELHRKLAILARRERKRLYELAEEGVAKVIAEHWNRPQAKK